MRDFDDLDSEMLDLEKELQREIEDMPGSDRENAQRSPHLAYVVLYTEEVEELAEFYEAVFGFDRRYESGTTIELQAGMIALAITDEGQLLDEVQLERAPRPFEARSSHTMLVEDVDRCFEAALAMGAKELRAPRDTDWGMRSGWVRDPAGHLLEIGRYLHLEG